MRIFSGFAEAIDYLSKFQDYSIAHYNLDNMRKLCDYLGNPQNKLKVVHIAGTSGKTSTAYFTSALLVKAGLSVGLTASPIVDQVNERVQINGHPLAEKEFVFALSKFSGLIDKAPLKPSYFELMVAFAFWYFAEKKLDYAVIEVGLGGLKDATNVISSNDKVCLITDIGYDHMHILGRTLEEIATQKAGIILPGNHVFMYSQSEEINGAVKAAVLNVDAQLHLLEAGHNPYSNFPDYQFRNWRLSWGAYCYLSSRDGLRELTDAELAETRSVVVPGRMDAVEINGKTVVMDGAHNTQKMSAFIESFKKLYPGIKPAVLLAMKRGKNHSEIAELLAPFSSRVITTGITPSHILQQKAESPTELASIFNGVLPVKAIGDQEEAFMELINSPERVVVITGSIYLLGQLRNNPKLKLR